MPENIQNYIASGQPTLFAGDMLFRTGRVDTPLITLIGNRWRHTDAEKFIIGQTAPAPIAIPDSAVSEEATLTIPEFKPVGRAQETNVTEIHTKSLMVTDYSGGNRGMLGGFVPTHASGTPLNEEDFQRNQQHLQFLQDMEWALINSKFQDRDGDPTKVNKTRGLDEAIRTNVIDLKGNEMSWTYLNDAATAIADHGGSTYGLVLGCDPLACTQLAVEAKAEHFEVVTGVANINGIGVTTIHTIKGSPITLVELKYLPADGSTAFVLNVPMLSLVGQSARFENGTFGNFCWVNMGRTGLGRKEMFYGAFGLDYGAEMAHAKLVNIARAKPVYKGTKVFLSNPVVETTESLPEISGVTLDTVQDGVETAALALEYYGDPAEAPALTYQWKVGNSASGIFTDIEGATAATFTPDGLAGKYIRVEVKASGAATGTVLSNVRKVAAAAE